MSPVSDKREVFPEVVQPIACKRDDYRLRARLNVDCIVEKPGTGKSWTDVARANGIDAALLAKTFDILKSDGRWQGICSVLCNARGLAERE